MTATPKPRKGAAEAAPVKPAPKARRAKLARLRDFSRASNGLRQTANNGQESDAVSRIHDRERDKIESKLAELRPATMREVKLQPGEGFAIRRSRQPIALSTPIARAISAPLRIPADRSQCCARAATRFMARRTGALRLGARVLLGAKHRFGCRCTHSLPCGKL
jgi:hypothetical protein